MKGIVWGKTFERACDKLNEITERYIILRHKIVEEITTKNRKSVLFDNGDYWQAFCAKESFKGQRCNVSYIDHELEKYIDIIAIIKHCTTAMPFTGITYF